MLSFLEQYSYVKFLGIAIVMLSFVQMQQIPTLSLVYLNRGRIMRMLRVRYMRVQYVR